MTEILFYHLEQQPLDKVLPILLEKSLERGWHAVVEAGSAERLETLDSVLWTFREDSFLPHTTDASPDHTEQPIVLTTSPANPNQSQVRFFVDRALPKTNDPYDRLVFMFDGHDPDAVTDARQMWKALSTEHAITYWQQAQNGRWEKKAESVP